jgi:hypothetical protein
MIICQIVRLKALKEILVVCIDDGPVDEPYVWGDWPPEKKVHRKERSFVGAFLGLWRNAPYEG